MRRILLTRGQFAVVDDEDFYRINAHNWFAYWSPSTKSFYGKRALPRSNGKRSTQWMHREIFGLFVGDPPHVDHINCDTLDNRKENLRIATVRENAGNQRNQSKYGVGIQKKGVRFQACAKINGRKTHIATYDTPGEARKARLDFLECRKC